MKTKKSNLMKDVTKRYEDFIKDKEITPDGKKVFDKAIKKAAKPKPRGLK